MKQIAVIGMSSFGYYLARKLAELGNEVLVIDKNEAIIDQVKSRVAKAIVADATDKRTMQQLELSNMDVVVLSLGDKIEASILCAMHLKELGAKKIVAKALSEDHVKILELMGVHQIVFPERDIGLRLASSLHGTNIQDYLPLGSDLSIVEMIPLKEMIGKTLIELDFRKQYHCQILAIKSQGQREAVTIIPDPSTRIAEKDILIVMGRDRDLGRLQQRH